MTCRPAHPVRPVERPASRSSSIKRPPRPLRMRRPDLQKMMRTMNVTLSDVGDRKTGVPDLKAPDMALRARTYRFRAYGQFTQARTALLP